MIRLLILSFCVTFSMIVNAQSPWLEKKDNPEELHVAVGVSEDCFVSTEALKDTVHGVLIRSRIKPLTEVEPLPLLSNGES